MEATEVNSGKGKRKYVDDGFMYIFDKPSVDGMKLFCHCDKRNDHCKVRLHKNTLRIMEECTFYLLKIIRNVIYCCR